MDHQLDAARILMECFVAGIFEKLFPFLAEDCERHTLRDSGPIRGKEAVIAFYKEEEELVRRSGSVRQASLVRISDTPEEVTIENMVVNGVTVPYACVSTAAYCGKVCVLTEQKIGGETLQSLVIPAVDGEGMLTRLLVTDPALFDLIPVGE